MAPASGTKTGKPSLSSLQAALRTGTPASTGRRAAIGDGSSATVGGAGSSLKRTAASAGGQVPPPPPKRRVSAASLQEVELAPAIATTSAVATVRTRGTPAAASAVKANSGFSVKMPAEGLRKPEYDNGVDLGTNGGAALGGQGTLVPELMDATAALGTAGRGTQLRHVVRLAEAFGRTLPIEHINHFLRVLKKKLVERAQQEGVRVQVVKASSAGSRQQGSIQAQESQAQRAMAVASSTTAATVASVLPTDSTNLGAVSKHPGKRHGVVAGNQPASVELQGADFHPGAVPKRHSIAKSKQAGAATKQTAGKQSRPPKMSTQASQSVDFVTVPLARDASPQRSPQRSESPPDLSSDPLYMLIGELTDNPVCQDGVIQDARLTEVLKRLRDGIARKPKDWVVAWQAMVIPMDRQVEALQKFLNLAFMETEDPELAPLVAAELCKAHKIKTRSMEEVLISFGPNLDGIVAMNEDAWQVYSNFLVHVSPKPAGSGWGWSRVGWSWQTWWQFVEKCTQSLDPSRAYDVIALILRLIQDREGQPLGQLPSWTDGEKLQRVIAILGVLSGSDSVEVLDRLSLEGVDLDVM